MHICVHKITQLLPTLIKHQCEGVYANPYLVYAGVMYANICPCKWQDAAAAARQPVNAQRADLCLWFSMYQASEKDFFFLLHIINAYKQLFVAELCQDSENSCAKGADAGEAAAGTGGKRRKLQKKFSRPRGWVDKTFK